MDRYVRNKAQQVYVYVKRIT